MRLSAQLSLAGDSMIDLKYSLVIEATKDPTFFTFYSLDLEGFTGVGHSIEDCLYRAKPSPPLVVWLAFLGERLRSLLGVFSSLYVAPQGMFQA